MQSTLSGGILIDGMRLASVTSVLQHDPRRKTFYKSQAVKKKQTNFDGDTAATGQHRGTTLHACFADYITTGSCDVPEIYLPYWEQLYGLVSRLDITDILWAEKPMSDKYSQFSCGDVHCIWSNKHKYMGKPDLIASVGGVPAVWEIKTSRSHYCTRYDNRQFRSYGSWFSYAHAAMQVSAYSHAFNEQTNADINTGIVINVMPDDVQLFVIEGPELKSRFTNFRKLLKEFYKQPS